MYQGFAYNEKEEWERIYGSNWDKWNQNAPSCYINGLLKIDKEILIFPKKKTEPNKRRLSTIAIEIMCRLIVMMSMISYIREEEPTQRITISKKDFLEESFFGDGLKKEEIDFGFKILKDLELIKILKNCKKSSSLTLYLDVDRLNKIGDIGNTEGL